MEYRFTDFKQKALCWKVWLLRHEQGPCGEENIIFLREGYIKSAEFLLKNLPLDNNIITSLSPLTPSLIQCNSGCGAFMTLGKALPYVVWPEELGQLEEEVWADQIDVDLVSLAKTYVEEDSRVDMDWWSRVAFLKTTERDNILEADRCSMNVETYESLAIIKLTMKARNWTASTMMSDQPLRRSCLYSYQNDQFHLQKKKASEQALKKKRIGEAIRMRSTAVAN